MRSSLRWAAVALAAVALGGCFGKSAGNPPPSGAGPHINVRLGLANCTDWKRADAEERLGTLHQLRSFAGGPVVGAGAEQQGRGAVLDDKQAYRLFQNSCGKEFARGFKLYKLYERAAAFAGHQP